MALRRAYRACASLLGQSHSAASTSMSASVASTSGGAAVSWLPIVGGTAGHRHSLTPLLQHRGQLGTAWAHLSQAALQHQAAPGHTYTLTVHTGNLRGAGSATPAWVQLVGSQGKTDRMVIGNTDEDSLDRGSQRTFTVTVPEDIGQPRFLHVQRLASSITEAGTGWFLSQVTVAAPDGQRYVFPCNAWLGESDCGGMNGPLERNLLPVAADFTDAGQPVRLSASGVAVPHPDKVKYDAKKGVNRKGFGHGGEDAYFYCPGKNDTFAMGVADGVFMWREHGIDSGDFSRSLMLIAEQSVKAGLQDVVHIMQTAAAHAHAEGIKGSSTICLAVVDQAAGQLYTANLGDSGLLLLRRTADSHEYTVAFRTDQLEHDFGRPFQLGHHANTDSVEKCDVATLPLHKGDVIVLGTDGLLDNLSDLEIAQAVAAGRLKFAAASTIAQQLARKAFEASYDKHRSTPYAMAASEHFDMVYSGGKPDDITVLVALCE